MLRHPGVSVSLMLALALLAFAGPAAAHAPAPTPAASLESTASTVGSVLNAASTPPAPAWYLPAALALTALTAWYRPRRAVAVTLVLLLCVFAFENALHSVHHGFDVQQQEACTVAAASAHLAAVQVDDPAMSSVVLHVVGRAAAAPAASIATRFLGPDQGRAPPSAIR